MRIATEGGQRRSVPLGVNASRMFDFSPWGALSSSPLASAPALKNPAQGVSALEQASAGVLLLLFTPLMLFVALAIKLNSPRGPVIYRQERVGLDRRRRAGDASLERRDRPGYGQMFLLCKFRTMVPDAERLTGPVWAAKDDPRVTRVGSVLRRLRIDELPQLINVLRGEMRLIGPRPERAHFVEQLCLDIPEYAQRLRVPPGITGLAQVEREYDSSVADVRRKVRYDLFYVQNRCRLLDLKILLKTIDVALRGRGAR